MVMLKAWETYARLGRDTLQRCDLHSLVARFCVLYMCCDVHRTSSGNTCFCYIHMYQVLAEENAPPTLQ